MSVSDDDRVFGCEERKITLEQERKTLICVWGSKQHMLIARDSRAKDARFTGERKQSTPVNA
jgi:hypothetical protein